METMTVTKNQTSKKHTRLATRLATGKFTKNPNRVKLAVPLTTPSKLEELKEKNRKALLQLAKRA